MNRQPTEPTLPGATKPMPRVPAKDFLLLHATLLLYALVSVLGKFAGQNLAAQETVPAAVFIALEFLALGVYAVLWQQTLKRMPLSFAYSNKAVCTLWSCLAGLLLFGEPMTLGKAAGLAVTLAGVWLVVSDRA